MVLADPRDAEHFCGAIVAIRPASADELPYIRASFSEGYKQSSNALAKLPWPTFKRDYRPRLLDAIGSAEVLVAAHDGWVLGWLALSRGRRVDTVHWMATRLKIGLQGQPLRRNGIMRQLVNAADLRDRIVYTHRGVKGSHEWIAKWLARRGAVSVIYEPYERWKA